MVTTRHPYSLRTEPRRVTLRDGNDVLLRPMQAEDGNALLRFFRRMPSADLYYLKEDVSSPRVIERWAKELDYDRALPILAWAGNEVVADGTLHRQRAGARRHLAEVRIVVDPKYRNLGLGTQILHELLTVAREASLERVFMELVADREENALRAAEWWGFKRAAVLTSYAKDPDGQAHDVVLLDMPLADWFSGWPF